MDGTAIMQGMATIFISNFYGIDLIFVDFLTIIITAALASIGTAGVPGVGMIMLGMVLNQVGLPLKMFVLDGEPAYAIFNPRITYFGEEEILLEEGCLSYPGLSLKIRRPRFIRARFQDPYGDYVTKQFDGITARVFQHEFDHINGVDFTQKVSKLKRDMAIKKWKKKYGRTKLSLPI